MKKRSKRRNFQFEQQVEPDVAGLIAGMQQQLTVLEKKLDTLIGQSQSKPFEARYHQRPFQRFERFDNRGEANRDNERRERVLHKAVCADCSKECEVPFRPTGDRPVYCKECFSKRKAGSQFRAPGNVSPREADNVHGSHYSKVHSADHKRADGRKKPVFRKRKKH